MARTTKRGKCELCGEVANVGTNHGSVTCPKCTHVQAALANRLQAVAKAARAMGKAEDLIKAMIPDGGSLAVQVTATLLQEISGIVGYEGEDPAELVAAVRKRVLTCVSCDCEDVLHEIREIVGYTPEQGDKGLADAVRRMALRDASKEDCSECAAVDVLLKVAELANKRGSNPGFVVGAVRALVNQPWPPSGSDQHRVDLLRACGLELDDAVSASSRKGWSWAAAVAVQTIAELTNRRDDLLAELTMERANNARLCTTLNARHSESEQVTALRDELSVVRAELTLAQQARDEWEQRCAAAEKFIQNTKTKLCDRDNGSATNADNTYLLDIALRALRGEGPDTDQLASLIEAARRAA